MPDWVQGPAIGPEALAVAMGHQTTSPGGAKEIYVDSGVLRSQYENGMPPDPSTYQPEYTDVSAAPAQTPAGGEPMLLPPEVLEAMKNGQPPPAHLMVGLAAQAPGRPALPAPPREQIRVLPGPLPHAAAEMVIPVGNGITARVSFDSAPRPSHYRKLIRHLEIEADSEIVGDVPGHTMDKVYTPPTRKRGRKHEAPSE